MTLPNIVIHPLALLQITQNATHLLHNDPTAKGICGILIGTTESDTITIFQSAQIPSNQLLEKMDAGADFLHQTFEEYNLLGWYSHHPEHPTQEQLDIHKQVVRDVENRVYLKVDLSKTYDEASEIPIKFYVVRNDLFVEVKYHIASVEIERIGVTDIFNAGSTEKKEEMEKSELTHAIKTLKTKTEIIVKYLKAIQDGKIEKDEKILVKIAEICERLPVSDNRVFKEEFERENEDAKLMVMMMELLKAAVIIGEQTHSYAELKKDYADKIRREEEKRRMDGRMMDERMGGFGMGPMGFGGRNMMGGMMDYDDMDEDDD